MSRALGLEGGLTCLLPKPAGQLVLEGDTLTGQPVELLGKACLAAIHMDTHLGGGGKGISLYVVDR